ncbi:MAG: hypothetical protein QOD67_1368 [Caballeronia sp.]|nr:hypothetical protein [Caballeronia sp.]
MAAEAEVIASLLRCARGAIAMDDTRVQTRVLMKSEDRALENGIQASVRFPPPEGAIDARVMDLGAAVPILLDGQLLPLAAEIERFQDVVEDCVRAELSRRAATASAQMRPDKLLELPALNFVRISCHDWLWAISTFKASGF